MRCPTLAAIAASLLLCLPATAQTSLPEVPADPVVARIGGEEIHADELSDAAQALPEELRGMPPQMLYPMLLDQLIDRRAIVLAARKQGLETDPAVKKAVARATDAALQNILLNREISPFLTEDAIKARFQRDYSGKTGEEEVHAEHILVADEARAQEIIAQLKAGKSFEDLARENSTDPSAKTNNGDLGFFKRADMLPEFADAAFGLKPGEVTQTPVKTRFGWHVIKLVERRTAPPPQLDQVHDEIRQSLIQEGVARVLTQAKQGLVVQKFNQDGSPMADTPPTAPVLDTPAAPTPAK